MKEKFEASKAYQTLKSLCEITAISGNEHTVLDTFRALFGSAFDEIYSDNIGNIIMVKKCGVQNARRLVLDAHLDTIGLMVTDVFDDGFVSVCGIGGVDTRVLPASEVTIYGSEPIYGVIASTPPHLGGAGKVPKMEDILIDTGINDESIKDKIHVGDYVSIRGDIMACGNYVFSAGLDDRACLCSCIEAVLNADNLQYDVYVLASCMEESGAFGARTAIFAIEPDYVIATDVNFGREPNVEKRYSIECGKGPSVDLSVILDRALSNALLDIAKENDIPCQVVVEAGRTGTNADIISITGKGTRLALMSLPLKGMHTPSECVCLDDICALARLLAIMISTREDELWN